MNIKKLYVFILAVLLPILGFAQAQINTKKVKICDFTHKTTKVILTGNMFYDSMLEDAVIANWKISPYEFCSLSEFDELKSNDEYYFLLITKGQFKKESEPGLQFLTLVKGGSDSEKGIGAMLEIASLPFASAEDPSGRESTYFPAFINVIQAHARKSMDRDIHAYSGLSNISSSLSSIQGMTIVFSEDDFSSQITDEVKAAFIDENMTITSESDADNYMSDTASNVVVSYVVAPTDAKAGSYCYKMLFDNQSHTLYYYKKKKISKDSGVGFLIEDLHKISAYRTK